MTNAFSVFERYPRMRNLRGKVPDDIIERELGEKVSRFENHARLASELIPTVRLDQIFPGELERGRVTLERFLGQWGNITVEELCKICLIGVWLRPSLIVEFGTYNGMTTLQLAMNSPEDCQIVTIDVDPSTREAEGLDVGDIDSHLARKVGAFDVPVGQYFRGTPWERKIQQVLGDSTTLNYTSWYGRADLVFVDAGHTYRYISSDTENALKLVRPGGVVLWHDYMQVLHPDVTQYLYERARDGLAVSHLRGTALAVHSRSA